MAERRMFAKTIVLSDAFLDMPLGARCLYMTMGMLADDDGFVNAPRSIMRQTGASDDDMKVLIAKRFVLPFETGVIVIKHWRINNYLQKDRYVETKYLKEKAQLQVNEKGAYDYVGNVPCIHNSVYTGKDSIGKDRIGKNNNGAHFVPPSHDEISSYCLEKGIHIDVDRFIDYYTANGWKVGRNPMKDWKATVRNWSRQDKGKEEKESAFTQNIVGSNETWLD